jgi:hypothetical protein
MARPSHLAVSDEPWLCVEMKGGATKCSKEKGWQLSLYLHSKQIFGR